MNPASLTLFGVILCMAASVNGIFDGGITLALGGAALAAGAGSGVFLTSAGAVAAAAGLVGAAVVKGAIVGGLASRRGKREAESTLEKLTSLQVVDAYFSTILDVDVEDCGKKFVCEIMSLEASQRNVEESLIAGLFDPTATIDPLSPKSEYDLAAYVGANYNKETCARRYPRCTYDRLTIQQALGKIEQELEETTTAAPSAPAEE